MVKNNRGFTLIELLVVIAIIGVLSSIVLASLNTSRKRATDARVKTQLSHIRSAAEIYWNGVGSNSYGSSASDLCSANLFGDNLISAQIAGLSAVCRSSSVGYAVSVPLISVAGNWCIDYKGNSRNISSALGTGVIECPSS